MARKREDEQMIDGTCISKGQIIREAQNGRDDIFAVDDSFWKNDRTSLLNFIHLNFVIYSCGPVKCNTNDKMQKTNDYNALRLARAFHALNDDRDHDRASGDDGVAHAHDACAAVHADVRADGDGGDPAQSLD